MASAGLEFHVDDCAGEPRVFVSFGEAAGFALAIATSNGKTVTLDVVAWTEAAARAWGGDDAAESYREDPDASVFERIEVRANSLGRVA